VASSVLDNQGVRREIARRLVEGVATALPAEATGPLADFRGQVEDALASPALTDPLADVVVEVHRRLVGEATGPVVLDPTLVTAVLQQAAPTLDPALLAAVPQVHFDVPRASPLETARERLPGLLSTGATVAVVLVAAAFVIHPRRDRLLLRLGGWLLGASVVELLLLYLIPVVVAPALVDNVWTGLVAEVATASTGGIVGVLASMAIGGVGCLLAGWCWGWVHDHPRPGTPTRGRRAAAAAAGGAPTIYSPGGPPRTAPPTRQETGWRL
jgi:hypothetical protein